MASAEFDPERILSALANARVRYVLIGGMAVMKPPTKNNPMRLGRAAVIVVAFAGCALLPASFASTLQELTSLLHGEYNNNEQVWQQGLDDAPISPRTHWKWELASENSLSLSMSEGQFPGRPQWLFSFEEIEEQAHSEVHPINGSGPFCKYHWMNNLNGFEGVLAEEPNCAGLLPRRWQINDDLLSATPAGATDDTPLIARRVTYYSGWVALSRASINKTASEDDYIFLSGIRAHNEGSITPILDEGEPTGYAVELARLTYQKTQVAVLKLGIIEEATGKTLAYSWANPGAGLIGINLRWVQCGFTRSSQ